jgi:hypothetical protein
VVVAGTAADPAHAQHLAQVFNALVLRGLLSWIWIFLSVNAVAHGISAAKHLRRWQQARKGGAAADPTRVSG